jgi:hypothetical protein
MRLKVESGIKKFIDFNVLKPVEFHSDEAKHRKAKKRSVVLNKQCSADNS